MRFFEISSGFRVPVNAEEQSILDTAIEKHRLNPADLDERAREVARLMVSRGLLVRGKDDQGIFLSPNDSADLWRY